MLPPPRQQEAHSPYAKACRVESPGLLPQPIAPVQEPAGGEPRAVAPAYSPQPCDGAQPGHPADATGREEEEDWLHPARPWQV